MRLLVAIACVVLWSATARAANEAELLRGLATDDPAALAQAVTAIENAPTTSELADVLFAAGRACEDRLHDPARALAIYERIERELPDAGISISAGRRAAQLRNVKGYAKEAAELADLVARADQLPRADVIRRAEALVAAPWPGAANAALWLADWQCRTTQFEAAQARYASVLARWPDGETAQLARRNAAGCAIDAHDWDLAERLARALPTGDELDRAVREDLLESVSRGRFRAKLYIASWIGLVLAILMLLASLVEACIRAGKRWPALRPPIEVLFLAPIAAVIIGASFTAHRAIAPAVLRISLVGVAAAYVSGITLDLLRSQDRAIRARALLHVIACAVAVLSIGYIAIVHDNLLDMIAETVKFGPGA